MQWRLLDVGRDAADPAPALVTDVLVLGAGVVGVATAEALIRRGMSVTLVDRAAGPGEGASFANGGQLSYSYTDALSSSYRPRVPCTIHRLS